MPDRTQPDSWDPHSMVEPDLVLPEQFYERANVEHSGVRGLLWAVLREGIETYCETLFTGKRNSREYREAECWIFTGDSGVVTSFGNLCEIFSIDARMLRRRLLELRDGGARALPKLPETPPVSTPLFDREAA